MAAVIERRQVERVDQRARGVAGDYIHLFVRQCPVDERKVHGARLRSESQPVGPAQAGIPIVTLQKLVAESRRPASCHRLQVIDRVQAECACVLRPHQDGEGVVEAERAQNGQAASSVQLARPREGLA